MFFLLSNRGIEVYTYIFISSSFVYLIFVYILYRNSVSGKIVTTIVFVFLISKILFLFVKPVGSDDYYRYIWDGKVHASGMNPYLYAPNDPTLNSLHSELLPQQVSYPHIKTIYFPVAQWLFALNYFAGGESVVALKLLYLLFELLILFSLFQLLRRLKIDTKFILIYASLPLINFQYFVDAHIDLPGAALMLASVGLYFYDKKIAAYILLGLSLSIKPTGFLLIPIFAINEIGAKRIIMSLLFPPLIFVITFLPYAFAALPLDTLLNFTVNWTFNGMIYNFLRLFINDHTTVRLLCGALFAIIYFLILFKEVAVIQKIFFSIFLLIIFSPIAHPWYFIWFAVFLPPIRNLSGIYLSCAVSLSFVTVKNFQATGIWTEYASILMLQYIPMAALLIYDVVGQRKKTNDTPNY